MFVKGARKSAIEGRVKSNTCILKGGRMVVISKRRKKTDKLDKNQTSTPR